MRTILECVFHGLFKAIEHIPKQEKYLLRHATCNMRYYMKELYEFQKYPFFSQAHGEKPMVITLYSCQSAQCCLIH